MRLRSCTSTRSLFSAPPTGLSIRYAMFGVLLVMTSCTVSQPTSQFTPHFSAGAVRGFQIQIYSTLQKVAAEETMQAAEQWWAEMDDDARRKLFGVGYLPVEIKWLEPYYRVRIGHFRTRDEARLVLDQIAEAFPAAFIVPDTIL